jgi:hypothetical protein
MRKYSTERASANEFGGTMQTSPSKWHERAVVERLGSTIALLTFVKILNSCATRMSYPYEETP